MISANAKVESLTTISFYFIERGPEFKSRWTTIVYFLFLFEVETPIVKCFFFFLKTVRIIKITLREQDIFLNLEALIVICMVTKFQTDQNKKS